MFQTLTHPQDQQLRVLGRGLGLRAAGEARKGVPGPEPGTTAFPPPLPSNQYQGPASEQGLENDQ